MMNTAASIRLAVAILMPASLFAADRIKIEAKILGSVVTKIPHDIAEFAKLKGGNIMTDRSMTVEFSNEGELARVSQSSQPGNSNQEDQSLSTEVVITVKPERQGEDIAFKGCLKITAIVGGVKMGDQTQSETVTRTIDFSGKQKKGEEGWFDLINPPNLLTQKKITVWIRFEPPDAEQENGGGQPSARSESE